MTDELRGSSLRAYLTLMRNPQLLLLCLAASFLTPLLARLVGVPAHGSYWLTEYLVVVAGEPVLSGGWNLLAGLLLYLFGRYGKSRPLPFGCALALTLWFLLEAHAGLNPRNVRGIREELFYIQIATVVVVGLACAVGFVVQLLVANQRAQLWLARVLPVIAVAYGASRALQHSGTVADLTTEFPVVSVRELPLTKRTVYSGDDIGTIIATGFDALDSIPGSEIAFLGTRGIAILDPNGYLPKAIRALEFSGCPRCFHNQRRFISDNRGAFLITTDAGVFDQNGKLLWLHGDGRSGRLVAIRRPTRGPVFLGSWDSVVTLHDTDGSVLWNKRSFRAEPGVIVRSTGEHLPFVVTSVARSSVVKVFDMKGDSVDTFPQPAWSRWVFEVSLPASGNLLVGGGRDVGVVDQDGRELFHHVIANTSFNPVGGPRGTEVRFAKGDSAHVAAVVGGGMDSQRSVLVVFDHTGRLVWQEEMRLARTIVAVSRPDNAGEVLLVAGWDGVLEYGLAGRNE